jgi:DNA (cytosine-5)-methyltransferase 1
MLTSNAGKDFEEVIRTFLRNGYSVGALILDAKDFLPQSRKRVFIIGVRQDLSVDPALVSTEPLKYCHPSQLTRAFDRLPKSLKNNWLWFNIYKPVSREKNLIDILEPHADTSWNTDKKTRNLLSRMSPVNMKKVEAAQNTGIPTVGALFMRTRKIDQTKRVFAEVRFDGISGCLRTPNGGSSRQSILYVHNRIIRSRLLTGRETARLMGLPENYKLPENQNSALHLTGDGVAVPVVTHLKTCLFEHILTGQNVSKDTINKLFKVA